MDGLHVVDVKSGRWIGAGKWRGDIFWEVHLSDGKVIHVLKTRCPDELSAYTYITNRLKLKEQANGTNSRAQTK